MGIGVEVGLDVCRRHAKADVYSSNEINSNRRSTMGLSGAKLAIDGGAPARSKPLPPALPGAMAIGDEEKKAVMEVLNEKNLFRYYGPTPAASRVAAFENEFSEHLGVRHALALSSGTAAVHTALVAAGVGPGDEVIVPAYTFIATAAAVIAARAVPVIAEVDDTLTMDPDDVVRRITPRTKALLPVHMTGAPCDMDRLMAIAAKHGLKLIEDSCQAVGASYKGRRCGTIGDGGAFSLQLHKIITTGEGGVLVTNQRELYDRALIFHDPAGGFRGHSELSVEFFSGINYRMNELCGAIALAQLRKLEGLLATMRTRKREILSQTATMAKQKGVMFRREVDPDGEAGVALIMYAPEAETAHKVAAALTAENVQSRVLFHPDRPDWHVSYHWDYVHRMAQSSPHGCPFNCPSYPCQVRYDREDTPRTLGLLGRAVRMDVSALLTEADTEEIAEAMNKVMGALL